MKLLAKAFWGRRFRPIARYPVCRSGRTVRQGAKNHSEERGIERQTPSSLSLPQGQWLAAAAWGAYQGGEKDQNWQWKGSHPTRGCRKGRVFLCCWSSSPEIPESDYASPAYTLREGARTWKLIWPLSSIFFANQSLWLYKSLRIWIDKKVQTVYNLYKLTRVVSTMLFGKFCIGFGSTQVYTTKHCAEPFRKVDL